MIRKFQHFDWLIIWYHSLAKYLHLVISFQIHFDHKTLSLGPKQQFSHLSLCLRIMKLIICLAQQGIASGEVYHAAQGPSVTHAAVIPPEYNVLAMASFESLVSSLAQNAVVS